MEAAIEDVGLLVPSALTQWQINALENMIEETDVAISLVVVNYSQGDSNWRGEYNQNVNSNRILTFNDLKSFYELYRNHGFYAFLMAERHLAWELGGPSKLRELSSSVPIGSISCISGAEIIECEPIKVDGSWNIFPDGIVDRVCQETDVVVRFGFGLVKGDILEAPPHGVLSFHPGDIRKYRGLGIGLSYYYNDSKLGITLQRINSDIDGGEIVAFEEVDISNSQTIHEAYLSLREKQQTMLAKGIKNLRDPSFSPKVPELGEYQSTSRWKKLSFVGPILLQNIIGRIEKRIRR